MQTYENLIKSYHIFFNYVKFFIRLISQGTDAIINRSHSVVHEIDVFVSSTIQRASAIRSVASDSFGW